MIKKIDNCVILLNTMKLKTQRHGPFVLVNSEVKYQNQWIQVREDQVIRSNGVKGIFGVMSTNNSVLILPIYDTGVVCLINEYRYAIDQCSLEVPAGGVDKGESLVTAARRELREEAGLETKRLTYLNYVNLGTAVIDSKAHMFVATKLKKIKFKHELSEDIKTIEMPFKQAVQKVMKGEIVHSACALFILKAWNMYESGELVI